jgi:anti-sigma B factor antagonist
MAPQDAHLTALPALEVDFGRPSIAVVTLRGEHDLSGKQRLGEALSTAGARLNVLIDLSECTFMDSSVIAAFFLARTRLAQRGGRLELVIPREATTVQRVAEVTVLDAILPIHETLSAAVAGLLTDRHSIHLRDLRLRFADPESRAAHCSCGWRGEARGGSNAGRAARRDGVMHVDQERRTATARAAATTPEHSGTPVLVP